MGVSEMEMLSRADGAIRSVNPNLSSEITESESEITPANASRGITKASQILALATLSLFGGCNEKSSPAGVEKLDSAGSAAVAAQETKPAQRVISLPSDEERAKAQQQKEEYQRQLAEQMKSLREQGSFERAKPRDDRFASIASVSYLDYQGRAISENVNIIQGGDLKTAFRNENGTGEIGKHIRDEDFYVVPVPALVKRAHELHPEAQALLRPYEGLKSSHLVHDIQQPRSEAEATVMFQLLMGSDELMDAARKVITNELSNDKKIAPDFKVHTFPVEAAIVTLRRTTSDGEAINRVVLPSISRNRDNALDVRMDFGVNELPALFAELDRGSIRFDVQFLYAGASYGTAERAVEFDASMAQSLHEKLKRERWIDESGQAERPLVLDEIADLRKTVNVAIRTSTFIQHPELIGREISGDPALKWLDLLVQQTELAGQELDQQLNNPEFRRAIAESLRPLVNTKIRTDAGEEVEINLESEQLTTVRGKTSGTKIKLFLAGEGEAVSGGGDFGWGETKDRKEILTKLNQRTLQSGVSWRESSQENVYVPERIKVGKLIESDVGLSATSLDVRVVEVSQAGVTPSIYIPASFTSDFLKSTTDKSVPGIFVGDTIAQEDGRLDTKLVNAEELFDELARERRANGQALKLIEKLLEGRADLFKKVTEYGDESVKLHAGRAFQVLVDMRNEEKEGAAKVASEPEDDAASWEKREEGYSTLLRDVRRDRAELIRREIEIQEANEELPKLLKAIEESTGALIDRGIQLQSQVGILTNGLQALNKNVTIAMASEQTDIEFKKLVEMAKAAQARWDDGFYSHLATDLKIPVQDVKSHPMINHLMKKGLPFVESINYGNALEDSRLKEQVGRDSVGHFVVYWKVGNDGAPAWGKLVNSFQSYVAAHSNRPKLPTR